MIQLYTSRVGTGQKVVKATLVRMFVQTLGLGFWFRHGSKLNTNHSLILEKGLLLLVIKLKIKYDNWSNMVQKVLSFLNTKCRKMTPQEDYLPNRRRTSQTHRKTISKEDKITGR